MIPDKTNMAKRPLLSKIYYVLAVLCFINALRLIANHLYEGIDINSLMIYTYSVNIFCGIILLGISELIQIIAQIEFNTRPSDNDYRILKVLNSIKSNTEKDKNDML